MSDDEGDYLRNLANMIKVEADQEVAADFSNPDFINKIVQAIRDSIKCDIKHLGVDVVKTSKDDDKPFDLQKLSVKMLLEVDLKKHLKQFEFMKLMEQPKI